MTSPRTWLSWHERSMTWLVRSTLSVPPALRPAPRSAQPRPHRAPPSTPERRYISLPFTKLHYSLSRCFLVCMVLLLNALLVHFCSWLREFLTKVKLQEDSPVVHTTASEINGRPVELRPRAPDSLDPQAALRRRTWNRDEVRPV